VSRIDRGRPGPWPLGWLVVLATLSFVGCSGSNTDVSGTDAPGTNLDAQRLEDASVAPDHPAEADDATGLANDASTTVDRAAQTDGSNGPDGDARIDAASEASMADSNRCSDASGGPREDIWIPDSGGSALFICTADMPCLGGLLCVGGGCDDVWECFAHDQPKHPCPMDFAPYCGCDGVTFMAIRSCPDRPYDRVGRCEDGVNCDPTLLRCSGPEPICPEGEVPSIVDGQYDRCVPFGLCACEFVWECPHREKYACDTTARRCHTVSLDAGSDVGGG
jgi:hypothetical protein